MEEVTNRVIVRRPRAAVFDAATTGRYWPQWHPATQAVRGAIDHPVRLGEEIVEDVIIGGNAGTAHWTCVEYDHPTRLALDGRGAGGTKARIVYTFSDHPEGTAFERALSYELPATGPGGMQQAAHAVMHRAMQDQSARAMERLGALLEEIIPA